MLSILNALMKVLSAPVWLPVICAWWFAALLSAPWRMLFYSDSFLGERTNWGSTFLVGIGMFLLIPYTFPTATLYSIMVPISAPFRSWIFGGIGAGQ